MLETIKNFLGWKKKEHSPVSVAVSAKQEGYINGLPAKEYYRQRSREYYQKNREYYLAKSREFTRKKAAAEGREVRKLTPRNIPISAVVDRKEYHKLYYLQTKATGNATH